MSVGGRGRGYLGRHHLRDEQRPGEPPAVSPPPAHAATAPQTTDADVDIRLTEGPVKVAAEPPPGPEPPARDHDKEPRVPLDAEDEKTLAELMFVDELYRPIVTLLEQFVPGEDGIVFNRKLRELESTLTSLCQDDTQLQGAFSSLRGAALCSAATARKLATVGASFTRQQRQNALRKALLNVMQSTFSKVDLLERTSPQILTNAATLMGDYFTEARLCNGSKVHLLGAPLLHYMRSLLASNDRRAHRALATQLMQNGRELLTTNASELDDLSISIRFRLLSPPPASIIWLLLSADLCINKFLPLSASLQTFYASNLDLLSDVEPSPNYSEVTYGSWKKDQPEKDEWKNAELPDSSPDLDKVDLNVSQLNMSQDDGTRKLRPILGAGARQTNSFTEFASVPVAAAPTAANQDGQDVWTAKSGLAKRYDLNSWRQNEQDDKEDVQDDFSASSDKFAGQQFGASDGYRDYQAANQTYGQSQFAQDGKYAANQFDGKFAQKYTAPPFVANDRYASQLLTTPPPPFPPPGDGKFNTPPPFVPPERIVAQVSETKYTSPPPFVPQDRSSNPQTPTDVKYNTPPPIPQERAVNQSFTQPERTVNQSFTQPERTVNQSFTQPERTVNQSFTQQERAVNQSFTQPERTVNQSFTQQERAVSQSFTTQERATKAIQPSTQDRAIKAVSLPPDRIVNQSFTQERTVNASFTPQERTLNQSYAQDRTVNQSFTLQERVANQSFTQERSSNQSFTQDRTSNHSFTQDRTSNQPFTQERTPNQSFTQERTPNQSFTQERTSSQSDRSSEKNFPSNDRPRRPPENWRKEKSDDDRNRPPRKIDWARQKSKDSVDEAVVEIDADGKEKIASADKYRNRPSRSRQPRKSEEAAEEAPKAPARRHAMEVPRSHKYWDHDDRLDKDYNS